MCLLAVLFQVHPETPLVIAANRDERLTRPAQPMQVLRPAAPRVLGGRDVLAGGTWLAVNDQGLCAGLTNRPSAEGHDPSRRSRGELPLILAPHARATDAVAEFQEKVRCSEYNACWLLVGDRDTLFYVVVGRDDRPEVTPLPAGIHVLENRPLDAISAKTAMIRRALGGSGGWRGAALVQGLHHVLRSHDLPPAGLANEPIDAPDLRLSAGRAACVHTPAYATRSATIVSVPAEPGRLPSVHYADGPPCTARLSDVSGLWRMPVVADHPSDR